LCGETKFPVENIYKPFPTPTKFEAVCWVGGRIPDSRHFLDVNDNHPSHHHHSKRERERVNTGRKAELTYIASIILSANDLECLFLRWRESL
jgi:hypothetical protein